jgi:hypothetical protein
MNQDKPNVGQCDFACPNPRAYFHAWNQQRLLADNVQRVSSTNQLDSGRTLIEDDKVCVCSLPVPKRQIRLFKYECFRFHHFWKWVNIPIAKSSTRISGYAYIFFIREIF